MIDIASKSPYPSCDLSNFAAHKFTIDGVECASMEGFLQSLKFKNIDMQKYVCTLVGYQAKMKGKNELWWKDQKLYWQGNVIDRHGQEYQDLLDRAYFALAKNVKFRRALMMTRNEVLTHSIGKSDSKQTILTKKEFCNRLMKIREMIKNGEI